MPEGDTIHRTAQTLRRALVDRRLRRVELPRRPPPSPTLGARIARVEARGKHLLIHADDGLIVHTHQRMTGSWHLYPAGAPWHKPRHRARVVLGVDQAVAVCFSAPVVEVLDAAALARHPALRQLGPDLCDPQVDLEAVADRVRHLGGGRAIGDVLLDQRVASGIGNVYRCDVLFLHGLHPATPVDRLEDQTLRSLVSSAAELLGDNLDGQPRTTVRGAAPGSLWVHGRSGEPCRHCASTIVVERLGEHGRYSYRCPTCQPA
ncbi:MAG: Fpg/Nei family DNA glycosylase [Nitriliruptoraceae bacterium]